MSMSIFEAKLAGKPKGFFLAAAALLEDQQAQSLADIGLDAERLAEVVDAWRGFDLDVQEALDELTKAVALSDLPAEEVRPYADALARRQEKMRHVFHGDKLADFQEGSLTSRVLGGRAAAVWLACPASLFAAEDAWPALSGNALAEAAALANPEILFDQAIEQGEHPSFKRKFGRQSPTASAELLKGFVERLANSGGPEGAEDALIFAANSLDELARLEQWSQGIELARHAIKALVNDATLDRAGEAAGDLALFAAKDAAALAELASAADNIRLCLDERPGMGTISTQRHGFVWAPNGVGGLRFPCSGEEDSISLADYALAFGEGPPAQKNAHAEARSDQFSPELAALAGELRRQGLAAAIEARGTIEAARALIECQNAFEAGKIGAGEARETARTGWARLYLMEAAESPKAPSRTSMRI